MDGAGNLINIKLYKPWDISNKWRAYSLGNGFTASTHLHFDEPDVYVFEGEPDLYCAAAFGIYGVTTGSASNYDLPKIFGADFERVFKDKNVVLCFDSDKAGTKASMETLRHLVGVAKSIKIINLDKSDINPHGLDPTVTKTVKNKSKRLETDFTDYMRKNDFDETAKQRFLELVKATPFVNATATPLPVPTANKTAEAPAEKEDEEKKIFPYDVAILYLSHYKRGANVYTIVHWNGDFYKWNGKAYVYWSKEDVTLDIIRHIQASPCTTAKARNNFAADVRTNVAAIVQLPADTKPSTWIGKSELSSCQYISMKNGIVNLKEILDNCDKAITVIEHSPLFFNLFYLPYDFDISADAPMFKKFLDSSLPSDADQDMIQCFAGNCLIMDVIYQVFLILHGQGSNGKGVLIEILTHLLGKENVSALALEDFGDKFRLMETYGKLLNVSADTAEIDKAHEGLIKRWTGGDIIQFEAKFRQAFSAVPTAKLAILTNELPRFADRSDGIWRRMRIVKFEIQFKGDMKDPVLAKKIIATELSGIFNWAVSGLRRLRTLKEFPESDKAASAKVDYRNDVNSARAFLASETILCHSERTDCSTMYLAYTDYCRRTGRKHELAENTFGREIKKFYPDVERRQVREAGYRPTYYYGVKLSTVTTVFPELNFHTLSETNK
jgi:P4 family phage/plasmid primase-like protien